MNSILVVAEILGDQISPVTWELLAGARQIRGRLETVSDIQIFIPFHGSMDLGKGLAQQLAVKTGLDTRVLPCSRDHLKPALLNKMGKINPAYILFAHTTLGRELAPGIAMALEASSISGVTGMDADQLVFFRMVMGNTQVQMVRPCDDLICVLSLVPGAFALSNGKKVDPDIDPGQVLIEPGFKSCVKSGVARKNLVKQVCDNQSLTQARVMVAAGRGIGEKENLDRVVQFAKQLPGSGVGASRPLVDQGWISYGHQVGITGTTVAPDLYIALGISGSSQHLAGMSGAKWVISVNTNPHAPICGHSDMNIIADANEFMDGFINKESLLNNVI